MAQEPESWWLDERAYAGRENLDARHARRYDAKMDAQAAEEIGRLRVVRPGDNRPGPG